ncbi:hypothetical protein MJO28_006734 [Puccinia striiformis f. sp. tritici]|uniref:Uncharacterized protein n=1 Tax=Puccinia striiformis f. sp. tritici TaxID=168172 RepID=A0ACC0EK01_9BASI|nr:hypothetical protein Pst134EA_011907 [Puccinia striiformis f. sp. tritici]KAH9468282.1 hypothetical protein Pst134EA_011907 [Puccinia striiformis f. sp. tritici]KAI7954187.1 hypothetical protein MJO28_006734 [Puccinia striiformis f. sp. tritici]KAI7958490.1 hypothetical protein MJO29_006707 [Puccinia striiformis f. sp. tritici]
MVNKETVKRNKPDEKMSRTNPIIRFLQASALLVCLVYVLRRFNGDSQSSTDWHVSSWIASNPTNRHKLPPECDPYGELGHLFTADNLHESRYIIFNDHRQPALDAPDQDWIVPSLTSTIHEHKFVELDFARNRTVIMIGDSIDRNLVTHFGRRGLAGTKGHHKFFEFPDHEHIPKPKLESHRIGMAHLPELNFSIYNWFLMGLGVKQEVPFFHPREDLPQDFEGRMETYFLPLLRANLIPKPDLIIVNTGFWDLEFLARSRGAKYNLPDSKTRSIEGPTGLKLNDFGDGNPLSLIELGYHRTRLRKFLKLLIDSLKSIYEPTTKTNKKNYLDKPIEIMYRSMQLGNASLTNAFAAERIHQLDESNRLVLKEFDIKVIEWGKMTIGLDSQLDDPSIHYGIGSAQYIFGDMLLFYLKRLISGSKDEWIGCDWIRNRNLHYQN